MTVVRESDRRRRQATGRRTQRGEDENGFEEDEESVGSDEDEEKEDGSPDSDALFERILANMRDLLSSLPLAA